jgi:DNA (cytosine-5)-methyltransferase 1
MRHGSLFSGIGGFDLASEWMGWENVFHCEWNPFGQKVLNYYWPNAITYHDITKTDFTIHRGRIDIITGGFPCQPYSSAGKRLGKEDERHLWPEMLRAIREIQPTWVVGENVRGLTNWNGGLVFDEVQAELEAQGYQVTPFLLPACAVNAPHRRDRIWFIAYSASASKRANELRCLRSENGEIDREGSQTIYDALRSNGIEGTTSDSDLLRCDQRIQYDEVNTGEGRINAFSHIDKGTINGDVANPELEGLQGCTNTREVSRKEGTLGREGDKFTTDFTSIDKKSNAANSKSGGEGRISIQSKKTRTRESNEPLGSVCGFSQSNNGKRNQWQNFPTISPICDGDDGLSDRLDGITFSKWRNESIKAGGNAIVPQVVHQIFKAIQQYNELDKQLTI